MTGAMRCATALLAPLAIVATIHSQQPVQPGGAANRTLTAVPGVKVGHFTLSERPTGCTVVLVDGDAVGGVSQRGGAPGTRETDLLDPLNMVDNEEFNRSLASVEFQPEMLPQRVVQCRDFGRDGIRNETTKGEPKVVVRRRAGPVNDKLLQCL